MQSAQTHVHFLISAISYLTTARLALQSEAVFGKTEVTAFDSV